MKIGRDIVEATLPRLITVAIKTLLEQRHLYQYVNVDSKAMEETIQNIDHYLAKDTAIAVFDEMAEQPWRFHTATFPVVMKSPQEEWVQVPLPSIEVTCPHCKNLVKAHNPGFLGESSNFTSIWSSTNSTKQIFQFPYQCQVCKGEPLSFLVRRDGWKLMLAGRSTIEVISVPDWILEEHRSYYSKALIARNTGYILAGLLYLRVLIEQHMRKVTSITSQITGDELSDEYAKWLNSEFPPSVPSLKSIYSSLSAPIHAAKDDGDQFDKSISDIDKHFRQLHLLPVLDAPRIPNHKH